MNFQQLRSVRETVRQGFNLTLVAEALHTSQPGVSRQLKELEDGIESARRYYNAVVRDLNTVIEQFPSNLVATRFKFEKRDFFELESPAAERRPVRVAF